MTDTTRQPAFPLARSVLALTVLAGVTYAGCVWILPPLFDYPAGGAAGVNSMALVVWLSSLVSLMPVVVRVPSCVQPTVAVYFAGAAARIALCIVSAVVLVRGFDLPRETVLLTLAVMYLPLLFVEAGFVAAYLWKKDSLPKAKAPAESTTTAGAEALA